MTLRLAFREPLDAAALFGFLAQRALPGVEEGDLGRYRRSLSLPHGAGVVTVLAPQAGQRHLRATVGLDDLRDLTTAVKRVRALFDLDADPVAVAEVLGRDPVIGPAVRARPGLRLPGHVDAAELAIRAVLGQQVSVAGARNLGGLLAARFGEPLAHPEGDVVRRFPEPATLAALTPEDLPMPAARARALIRLAGALAAGEIDLRPGADRDLACANLLAIPGIGPWTADYIRMRGLGDPDAFLPTDLGVRRAVTLAGLPAGPREITAAAHRWRPYRAYALQYLWAGGAGDARDVQADGHQTAHPTAHPTAPRTHNQEGVA